MTQTEALRLALEALRSNRRTHHYCEDTWYSCPKHEDGCANDSEGDECNCGADKANAGIDQSINAIKAALEAKDEPVAWGVDWNKNGSCVSIIKRLPHGRLEVIAVEYGPPRTWIGLTDKEINEFSDQYWDDDNIVMHSFIKAIEVKLKEKNK
jgi:hypothetical protein